jgi:hypothetical protein
MASIRSNGERWPDHAPGEDGRRDRQLAAVFREDGVAPFEHLVVLSVAGGLVLVILAEAFYGGVVQCGITEVALDQRHAVVQARCIQNLLLNIGVSCRGHDLGLDEYRLPGLAARHGGLFADFERQRRGVAVTYLQSRHGQRARAPRRQFHQPLVHIRALAVDDLYLLIRTGAEDVEILAQGCQLGFPALVVAVGFDAKGDGIPRVNRIAIETGVYVGAQYRGRHQQGQRDQGDDEATAARGL